MKYIKCIAIASILCAIINVAKAEEGGISIEPNDNYFKTWLQLREIRRFDKIQNLLNRLTEEEIVAAVKQTYDGIVEQKQQSSSEDYDETVLLAVRDFVLKYFKGHPERNPRPFLEMLENGALDSSFRLTLIQCLDKAYGEERLHFQEVCDNLIKMIKDTNEPLELRQAADSAISGLLGHRYYVIRMSQNELNVLRIKELLDFPTDKMPSETEKRIKVLADNYNNYIRAVLSLTERDLTLYERLSYSVRFLELKKEGFITDPVLIDVLDNTSNKLALSKNEFVEGTMQENEKIKQEKNQNKEQPSDMGRRRMLGRTYGFVQLYFKTFPEESPKPFLEMATDKNNDEDFRNGMLDILGDNDFYVLKRSDIDIFSNNLIDIAEDKENPISIRKGATDCLQRQLGLLETVEKDNEHLLQKINGIQDKAMQIRNGLAK